MSATSRRDTGHQWSAIAWKQKSSFFSVRWP